MAIVNQVTREFKRLLSNLSKDARNRARERFKNYCKYDPTHPALSGKFIRMKHKPKQRAWSIDAGMWNRALALVEKSGEDTVYRWFWIGTHEQYNGMYQ